MAPGAALRNPRDAGCSLERTEGPSEWYVPPAPPRMARTPSWVLG